MSMSISKDEVNCGDIVIYVGHYETNFLVRISGSGCCDRHAELDNNGEICRFFSNGGGCHSNTYVIPTDRQISHFKQCIAARTLVKYQEILPSVNNSYSLF